MTEDEHRENDVDDDIGQWIVLLFYGGRLCFLGVGHCGGGVVR